MRQDSIQEQYDDIFNHCYGCGPLNEHGLHITSYWDGEEGVAHFEPKPYHIAVPGYVNGGVIASVIDCHSIGTAAAAFAHATGQNQAEETLPRFLTASLHVDYLRPTPIGVPLEVRARATEIKGRKVVVSATLSAGGEVCARGEVVAVRMPGDLVPDSPRS